MVSSCHRVYTVLAAPVAPRRENAARISGNQQKGDTSIESWYQQLARIEDKIKKLAQAQHAQFEQHKLAMAQTSKDYGNMYVNQIKLARNGERMEAKLKNLHLGQQALLSAIEKMPAPCSSRRLQDQITVDAKQDDHEKAREAIQDSMESLQRNQKELLASVQSLTFQLQQASEAAAKCMHGAIMQAHANPTEAKEPINTTTLRVSAPDEAVDQSYERNPQQRLRRSTRIIARNRA